MSEATQHMIRLAQGNLCGTLSHLLTKNHNSKSIFVLQDEAKMNEINEKLEKLSGIMCKINS